MKINIYRYNPESDSGSNMQNYEVNTEDFSGVMLLDALIYIKNE